MGRGKGDMILAIEIKMNGKELAHIMKEK